MNKIILLALCTIAFSSCASIFCGSRKTVTFDTNIKQPVKLTIDGQKLGYMEFPTTFKIRRGFDQTIVKAETEGYEPIMLQINKTFNPVSVINLFDVLGWAIDAATGAITKPEFNVYEIEFVQPKIENTTIKPENTPVKVENAAIKPEDTPAKVENATIKPDDTPAKVENNEAKTGK